MNGGCGVCTRVTRQPTSRSTTIRTCNKCSPSRTWTSWLTYGTIRRCRTLKISCRTRRLALSGSTSTNLLRVRARSIRSASSGKALSRHGRTPRIRQEDSSGRSSPASKYRPPPCTNHLCFVSLESCCLKPPASMESASSISSMKSAMSLQLRWKFGLV